MSFSGIWNLIMIATITRERKQTDMIKHIQPNYGNSPSNSQLPLLWPSYWYIP